MQATTGFPHTVHWDSFQLADAVPRRLSELYRFEVRLDHPAPRAEEAAPGRSRAPVSYAPASSLPALFHID